MNPPSPRTGSAITAATLSAETVYFSISLSWCAQVSVQDGYSR
jgi:hypothetical protein